MIGKKLIAKNHLAAGDIIRCIRSENSSWFKEGETYLLKCDDDGDISLRDEEGDWNSNALSSSGFSFEVFEKMAAPGYGPWEEFTQGTFLPAGPLLIERGGGRVLRIARKLPEIKSHVRNVTIKSDQAYFTADEPTIEIKWDTEGDKVIEDSIEVTVVS